MSNQNHLVVFVLDVTTGKPAHNVPVKFMRRRCREDAWQILDEGATDLEGCIEHFTFDFSPDNIAQYRLLYNTASYFKRQNVRSLFPHITIDFNPVKNERLVLPLLISPFAYTTYKGA
ncbi:MAG: hydroxyisourate hydrolase [Gammaproteobacteria bacterium]